MVVSRSRSAVYLLLLGLMILGNDAWIFTDSKYTKLANEHAYKVPSMVWGQLRIMLFRCWTDTNVHIHYINLSPVMGTMDRNGQW